MGRRANRKKHQPREEQVEAARETYKGTLTRLRESFSDFRPSWKRRRGQVQTIERLEAKYPELKDTRPPKPQEPGFYL